MEKTLSQQKLTATNVQNETAKLKINFINCTK